jgi:hypothetical protein
MSARTAALVLFVVMAWVAFGPSLAYPLTDADDLILLSWVSKAAHPLAAFGGDWGLGNAGYRPLHIVSLWLSYHAFGVTALFHQSVNLALHLLCVWLLYGFLRTIEPDRTLAWLFAAMALVSVNTASPPTWISDRPTLFVAAAVLIWLRVAGGSGAAGTATTRYPVAWLIGLSAVALTSKESGVILPGLALLWALAGRAPAASRRRVVVAAVALIGGYVALRWWLFDGSTPTDLAGGFRFGYGAWVDLALTEKAIVAADNICKNLIAPWLPLFTYDGAWMSAGALVRSSVVWLPTLALVLAAARRPVSSTQWTGLALIGLTAVVHGTLFRYRMFYLSQIGVCLFVAGASWSRVSAARRRLITAIAVLAVLVNMVSTARGSRANLAERRALLRPEVFDQLVADWDGRIDRVLADRVLRESGVVK